MTTMLKNRPEDATQPDLIVGKSAAIVALRDMIRRIAGSSASVMISGPSGSGKEVVARGIHAASTRADKPYVALNCGAIPVDLMESELFGHERGAFTGAHVRRIGRFEEADKGTLFLDEIGDMRFDMQVKLLRVLEDGMVARVGGSAPTPVDVRIISATHQNIDAAIADNRFREDLYFRLGVVLLQVPDLASRAEDIPLLIAHFNRERPSNLIARFDHSGMARLMMHRWPGNVRELRNIVERANILFPGQSVSAHGVEQLLGKASMRLTTGASLREAAPQPADRCLTIDPAAPINLKEIIDTMELERIQFALDMADGVISEAARLLTLKRTTLIEKMRKHGVDRTC